MCLEKPVDILYGIFTPKFGFDIQLNMKFKMRTWFLMLAKTCNKPSKTNLVELEGHSGKILFKEEIF